MGTDTTAPDSPEVDQAEHRHVWGEGHTCEFCPAFIDPATGQVLIDAPDPCGHGSRTFAGECDVCATEPEPSEPDPTYLSMFREWVQESTWIGPAERPLVFHLERLCKQLDRDPLAPAAVSSAYLQAFSRLDRRRPGATDPGDGLVPPGAQRSIFEEMD